MNPDQIPSWLTDRPRDRRGLPVPWVNQWGSEDPERVTVRHDRHVGRFAVFMDDDPFGDPDFTRQNLARQRESAVTGRCQVCAHPVPWSRRWLVVADLSVERIKVDGRDWVVTTEPWLCERCARYAVTVCPALIRRSRAERLTLVPVTSKRQVRTFVSVGWVDGPLESTTRADPPVMWVKIAVPESVVPYGDNQIAVNADGGVFPQ